MIVRRTLLGAALALGGGAAALAQTLFDPAGYGAKGDGHSDDTKAVQRAIDACAAAGGGRVTLLPGRTYLTGTIQLRSHVTLEISEGAVLKGATDREGFREFGSLIFAHDQENIAVVGRGTIEGQGTAYFPTLEQGAYNVPHAFLGPWNPLDERPGQFHADGRPRMFILVSCRNVRLQGFRIHDAPTWTIHPIDCEDLAIEGITIDNNLLIPNNDGIDVDRCRRVRIANCAITAGDDCIILKSSRNFPQFGVCEDVTVTGCTLRSSSAGIKIEPEGPGIVRNAVFSDLTITRSNRGMAIFNRDGALVENLIFSNLVITTELHHPMWWGAAEAINISNIPRSKTMAPGTMRNLQFDNIVCRGESGVFIHGFEGSPLEDITFNNVQVGLERTTSYPCGFYDLRPNDYYLQVYRHRIAGVYAKWAQRLTLNDVSVHWAANLPDCYGPALEVEAVDGLSLGRFQGSGAHAGDPAQVIDAQTRQHMRSN
jgi:polygalacturonase